MRDLAGEDTLVVVGRPKLTSWVTLLAPEITRQRLLIEGKYKHAVDADRLGDFCLRLDPVGLRPEIGESRHMPIDLDHIILPVNNIDQSLRFFVEILGLTDDGDRDPFSIVRVSDRCTIQLAPWQTSGGNHLAFALDRKAFDDTFSRIKAAGLEYGDAFDEVGNMRGPGVADGARGSTRSLYCFDPNLHLIEIIHYEQFA